MLKRVVLAALLAVPAVASAQGGVYFTVGGAMGSTDMGNIEASYGPGAAIQTDDDVVRAIIGMGAQVGDYLAFEATFQSAVENTVSDATDKDTLEHSNLQLAALGRGPLGPQFAVLGKLSLNYASTEYEYRVLGTPVYSEDQTGAYLGAGIGAEFRANDNIAFRLMVERIMMTDIIDETFLGESGDVDVDQVSLMLNYFF